MIKKIERISRFLKERVKSKHPIYISMDEQRISELFNRIEELEAIQDRILDICNQVGSKERPRHPWDAIQEIGDIVANSSPSYCIRADNHEGPCNGFPRKVCQENADRILDNRNNIS